VVVPLVKGIEEAEEALLNATDCGCGGGIE